MQIQILSVDVKTVPTTKGSYQTAELAYKNLSFQGKVEGRKIMSFGATANTFKTLAVAQPNSIFDITVVKNDKGFNDWTVATPSDGSAPAAQVVYQQQPGVAGVKQAAVHAATPVRSSYETPEERAQRQVFIIRQSNISSAINLLGTGAKAPPKLSEVLETAKAFEDYVLGVKPPIDEPSGFEGMDSDAPL